MLFKASISFVIVLQFSPFLANDVHRKQPILATLYEVSLDTHHNRIRRTLPVITLFYLQIVLSPIVNMTIVQPVCPAKITLVTFCTTCNPNLCDQGNNLLQSQHCGQGEQDCQFLVPRYQSRSHCSIIDSSAKNQFLSSSSRITLPT